MSDRATCIACDAVLDWTKAEEGTEGWSACHPCGLAAWELFPDAPRIGREELLALRARREAMEDAFDARIAETADGLAELSRRSLDQQIAHEQPLSPHGPVCLPPRFSGMILGMFPVQIGESDQVLLVQPDDRLPVC